MVSGQQRVEKESSGFTRKVGFINFSALGFSPATNEEVKSLGGYVKDDAEAPVYLGEKEGQIYARLDFYLQEVGSEFKYRKSFFLRNEVRKSKNKEKFNEAGEGRTQYINSIGMDAWVFSEKELSEKFRAYDYHAARSGETEIISFLKTLYALEFKAELTYDWKKVLNGNFKEIAEDVKQYARTIILPMEVELKPDDTGGVKEIQTNYNYFIPGDQVKFLNNKRSYSKRDIEGIKEKEAFNFQLWKDKKEGLRSSEKNKWITDLEKAVLEIEKNSKNCYYLGVGKEYKKEDFEQSGDSTIIDDEFDSVPAGSSEDEELLY